MKLKAKYNQWLFTKYGFDPGLLFEHIPFIYKICPLFSPSLYWHAGNNQIASWIREGINSVNYTTKEKQS